MMTTNHEKQRPNQTSEILTKSDVARICQISKRSVNNLMNRGLPYVKLAGKLVRFRRCDVEAYLNSLIVKAL